MGDALQGAAVDCNSAEVTHAWFDSRVAHHFSFSFDLPDMQTRFAALVLRPDITRRLVRKSRSSFEGSAAYLQDAARAPCRLAIWASRAP